MTPMDQLVGVAVGTFGLLVLLAWVIHREFGLEPVVAGLLSVSTVSVGVLATVWLQDRTGLTVLQAAIVVGLATLATVLAHNARQDWS